MNAPFKDIKPFPIDNPRAVVGNNKPPLEESILMDFDANLRGREGLIARIDAMVAKAEEVKPCDTQEAAGRYTDFIKMASTAAKVIEEEREKLNRPLLTSQKALKARADFYSGRALAAGNRVRAELDKFLAAEEVKRRAEVARLAEIERQAEVERQRVIRAAEDAARAETARLQKIADDAAAAERDRLQAIEDARAAAEQREAAAVVVEAVVVEAVEVHVPKAEPVFVSAAAVKAPVRGEYGSTASVTETWDVKVINIRQVPDAYLKHPSVLEALEKVIRPAVRGKNGLRTIKGCEISSTMGSAVR